MTPAARRFYAVGLVVSGLMVLTAARWFAAQSGTARAVGAGAFVAGAGLGVLVMLLLAARRGGSPLSQDPARPGNRWFWRLALGAVLVAVFDEALSGVPIFAATGFMTGLVGSVLARTWARRPA